VSLAEAQAFCAAGSRVAPRSAWGENLRVVCPDGSIILAQEDRPTVPVAIDPAALYRAAAERNALARTRTRRRTPSSDHPTVPLTAAEHEVAR
jgi:hypothetical protein